MYGLAKLLKLSASMNEICKPLSTHLNTPYFNFVRRFKDDRQFFLTTDIGWSKNFFENNLYEKLSIERGNVGNDQLNNKILILPWSAYPNSPVVAEQIQFSNIGIGLSLAFTKENYTDFYHFGTFVNQRHMTEYYLSNIDMLLAFSHYFQDINHENIMKSVITTNTLNVPIKTHDKKQMILLPDREEFKNAIKHRNISIDVNKKNICISERERQCLKYLLMGLSSNETGYTLNISKRTVESHIENIKAKTGAKCKSDLVKLIVANNYFNRIIED